ncbi:hypothetical protein GTP91_14280 [Rugamonas sp. FT82W]|uniref:Tetratricopeptide repeat protein n=1 Tax=Duganella vulcania TaxID=2692166 RepID=A0A845G639_9BURK|nr:hypothetical protein [Duganella vulcania]MYM88339.1 hypothetical protein [Duganella vulcania]
MSLDAPAFAFVTDVARLQERQVVLVSGGQRGAADLPARLPIDPNHVQALALSGSAALERGDYAAAVKPWKKILALGRSISENIAKAEAQAQRR